MSVDIDLLQRDVYDEHDGADTRGVAGGTPGGMFQPGDTLADELPALLYGRYGRQINYLWQFLKFFRGYVHRCANIKSEAVAAIPLRLYAKVPKGKRPTNAAWRNLESYEARHAWRVIRTAPRWRVGSARDVSIGNHDAEIIEITQHPSLEALRSPSKLQDPCERYIKLLNYVQILGDGYLQKFRDGTGIVRETFTIPSHMAWPIIDSREGISGYAIGYGGQEFVPESEIVHFKQYALGGANWSATDPSGLIKGQSLVDVAISAISNLGKMDEYDGAHLDRKGAPYFAIIWPEQLGDEQRERLKATFRAFQMDPTSQGLALMLENGCDIKIIGEQTSNRGIIASGGMAGRDAVVQAICAAFGVPFYKMSFNSSVAGGVANVQQIDFLRDSVMPFAKSIEGPLNNDFLPEFGDPRLFFAHDNPLPPGIDGEAAEVRLDLAAGLLTVDEARKEQGRPPMQVRAEDAPGDEFELAGDKNAQVTSALAILEKVSAGTISKKAGLAMLQFLGIPDDKAAAMIGGTVKPGANGAAGELADDPTAGLNGAQITAALTVIQQVTSGDIPKATAVQLLKALGLADDAVAKMLAGIDEDSKPEAEEPEPEGVKALAEALARFSGGKRRRKPAAAAVVRLNGTH